MARTPELKILGKLVRHLRAAGYEPVLVGGMALIVYGSSRATFDTDLLTARPGDLAAAKRLMAAVFAAGFVYVTRIDADAVPIAWIDVPNVAAARMMTDRPDTCFFWNRDAEMRVDLLLDFPLEASGVLHDSNSIELGTDLRLAVASLVHMAALKEIAVRDGSRPEDALDLTFIRSKLQQ
jgi:hypothetical protein